jgi:hypothetical protein
MREVEVMLLQMNSFEVERQPKATEYPSTLDCIHSTFRFICSLFALKAVVRTSFVGIHSKWELKKYLNWIVKESQNVGGVNEYTS